MAASREQQLAGQLGGMEMASSQVTIVSAPSLDHKDTIRLSWRRWPVLFAFFLFGVTSFLTGELGSILNTMLELLELPLDRYIYISLLFSNIPILTTMPMAWFVDRYGIRATMYLATLLMLARNTFRALMFMPDLPHWQQLKLVYWIVSGACSYQVLSIYFCLPLKVSENWFSKAERSFAWTVMISVTGIGTSLAAYLYPRLVQSVADVRPLAYLNLAAGALSALAVLLCITRSRPKHPPSERTIKSSAALGVSYLASIRRMFAHRDMMIHMVCVVITKGTSVATLAVLQDILLNSGHTRIFIGNLMSVSSLVNLVSLIGLSPLVHRMRNKTLVCKLSKGAEVLLFSLNMLVFLYPNPDWLVMLVSVVAALAFSWANPNMNDMNAHLASGVVSEATVSGFTTTLMLVTITLSKAAFVALISKSGARSDYTLSAYFAITVCSVVVLIYVTLFKGQRLQDKEEKDRRSSL